MIPLPADRILRLLTELKAAYPRFTWESALWADSGRRRSPYRTLALFGLSPRTRDALLVRMCRRFFRRFPDAAALSSLPHSRDGAEAARSIVRPGQMPFVLSMADAVAPGVPRQRDELLRIKGVGAKIAECVLAYGWGDAALPLDTHCLRTLGRVFGPETAGRTAAPLRQGLKCVYRQHAPQFAAQAIAMVDIHEILRLHGQVCCARTPQCFRCPVSGCVSRRQPPDQSAAVEVSPALWDDWRELLDEPAAI